MGAKKVIMFGLSPLGCLPILNMIKTCSPVVNAVLKWYNGKLKELVDKYNNRPGVKFIYINTMDIISADNLKNIGKFTFLPFFFLLVRIFTFLFIPLFFRSFSLVSPYLQKISSQLFELYSNQLILTYLTKRKCQILLSNFSLN